MRLLPPDWIEHASAGVSLRVGSCDRAGNPSIGRGLAAEVRPDGVVRVLMEGVACEEVLAGVRDTGHISVVMGLPTTHRTLHLKGQGATASRTEAAADHELLQRRLDAFAEQLAPFGFSRARLVSNWYDVAAGDLWAVSFTIADAWDQTPGPGAGQPVALRS